MEDDEILNLAIDHSYLRNGCYEDGSTKNKKRSIRKRAEKLIISRGEIFIQKNNIQVSLISSYNYNYNNNNYIIIIIIIINYNIFYNYRLYYFYY